jgi:Bacterial regulatory proteins, luxR family/3-demethylubiquinone-9 3-methyltransferase
MPALTPMLWFDTEAEQAAEFYTSVFPNSKIAEGASNEEVAAALYVTPKTVEYHLTRVYRKLGLRSRAELVRQFTQSAESN